MATNSPSAIRTLLLVTAVAVGAAAVITVAYEFSRERIANNERARVLANLRGVTATLTDSERLTPTQLRLSVIGEPADPNSVFAMRDENDAVHALIYSVSAPDGYNGAIDLLVGVSLSGTVTGVRVVSHRETPGLGDAIEAGKSNWLEQFAGKGLNDPQHWAVEKDNGPFDSLTGATVTPRAVVAAIHRTLTFHAQHSEKLLTDAEHGGKETDD